MTKITFDGKGYAYLSMFSTTIERDKFFKKLKPKQVFIFSTSYSFNEVEMMAGRRGIIVKHLPHATESFAYVIKNELIEKKIFHFNEEGLDI